MDLRGLWKWYQDGKGRSSSGQTPTSSTSPSPSQLIDSPPYLSVAPFAKILLKLEQHNSEIITCSTCEISRMRLGSCRDLCLLSSSRTSLRLIGLSSGLSPIYAFRTCVLLPFRISGHCQQSVVLHSAKADIAPRCPFIMTTFVAGTTSSHPRIRPLRPTPLLRSQPFCCLSRSAARTSPAGPPRLRMRGSKPICCS